MEHERPLFIPVILGTSRKGRMSRHAAKLVTDDIARRVGVETELIDIASMRITTDDAGEAIKDPAFADRMKRADAFLRSVRVRLVDAMTSSHDAPWRATLPCQV